MTLRAGTGARLVAVGCLAAFQVGTTVLTATRPDISFRGNLISDLLVGRYSGAATATFMVLAVGGAALAAAEASDATSSTPTAVGATPRPPAEGAWRTAAICGVYAASVLVTGLTWPHGAVHAGAALVAFVSSPVAVLQHPRLRPRHRVAFAVVVAAAFGLWPWSAPVSERTATFVELLGLGWLALSGLSRRSAPTGVLGNRQAVRR